MFEPLDASIVVLALANSVKINSREHSSLLHQSDTSCLLCFCDDASIELGSNYNHASTSLAIHKIQTSQNQLSKRRK